MPGPSSGEIKPTHPVGITRWSFKTYLLHQFSRPYGNANVPSHQVLHVACSGR
jgi:hypothetical protein